MKDYFQGATEDHNKSASTLSTLSIHKKRLKLAEQYYLCIIADIESRTFSIFTKQIIKNLQILHTIIVYLLISQQSHSSILHIGFQWLKINEELYRPIKIYVYIVSISTILLIVVVQYKQLSSFNKLRVAELLIRNIPLFSQANLCSSSFLMLISFKENLIAYVMSLLVYFYSNIFFVNDTNRHEVTFITSSLQNLYFCTIFSLTYTANCISFTSSRIVIHKIAIIFGALLNAILFISYGNNKQIVTEQKYAKVTRFIYDSQFDYPDQDHSAQVYQLQFPRARIYCRNTIDYHNSWLQHNQLLWLKL